MRNKILFIFLPPLALTASEKPNYLQYLPKELWQEVLNFSMADKPLWRDEKEITRIDTAIHISILAQKLCNYNLQHAIIARMRQDLLRAPVEILEPFYPKDMTALIEAFSRGQIPPGLTAKQSQFSDENPKMFQKLLPVRSNLIYCDIDKEWMKNFLASRSCGGTLRKHIFITALDHKHEYLVNYLWNSRYRTKIMKEKMRNRSFIRMAQNVAKRAGYDGIYDELKKAHDKLTEMRKAAQVWYPG